MKKILFCFFIIHNLFSPDVIAPSRPTSQKPKFSPSSGGSFKDQPKITSQTSLQELVQPVLDFNNSKSSFFNSLKDGLNRFSNFSRGRSNTLPSKDTNISQVSQRPRSNTLRSKDTSTSQVSQRPYFNTMSEGGENNTFYMEMTPLKGHNLQENVYEQISPKPVIAPKPKLTEEQKQKLIEDNKKIKNLNLNKDGGYMDVVPEPIKNGLESDYIYVELNSDPTKLSNDNKKPEKSLLTRLNTTFRNGLKKISESKPVQKIKDISKKLKNLGKKKISLDRDTISFENPAYDPIEVLSVQNPKIDNYNRNKQISFTNPIFEFSESAPQLPTGPKPVVETQEGLPTAIYENFNKLQKENMPEGPIYVNFQYSPQKNN